MSSPVPPLRPTISVQLGARAPADKEAAARRKAELAAVADAAPWRASWLLHAPHRLGFFLASCVLVLASLWWALVQVDRATGALHLAGGLPQIIVHGTVMVLGFMPLYFAGFLFTAGPKWLHVDAPTATDIRTPLLLQAVGWALWLTAGVTAQGRGLALGGGALALGGLLGMVGHFWKLVRASTLPDRLHARTVGVAGVVGCISLAGVLVCVALERYDLARLWVLTALWGFIVPVFVAVAHRMIPFFTSNAVPLVQVWRPFWVLGLMLGASVFEVLAVWIEGLAAPGTGWLLLRGLVELGVAGMLLWLAVVWGLVQSLRVRLLAMLHIGFVWLGVAYALSAVAQFAAVYLGSPVFGWGGLHALTMGCIGSLILAMVTRVSCGHSGRALVADEVVWTLFWLLQAAVVLRLIGALPGTSAWWITAAALLWFGLLTAWSWRYARWYGKPRADGKEG